MSIEISVEMAKRLRLYAGLTTDRRFAIGSEEAAMKSRADHDELDRLIAEEEKGNAAVKSLLEEAGFKSDGI